MRDPEESVADAVERISPPERPEFFDEFWEAVRSDQESRRRKRKFAFVAATVAAVAAVAAAGVYAAPALFSSVNGSTAVIDSSYSCAVEPRGDSAAFDLTGGVTIPNAPARLNPTGKPGTIPAFFDFYSADKRSQNMLIPQIEFTARKGWFKVDRSVCRSTTRHIAVNSRGLASQGTVTLHFLGDFSDRCLSARRVLIHVRLTMKSGVPDSAEVVIRDDTKASAAIAFVKWQPRAITYYLAARCSKSQ